MSKLWRRLSYLLFRRKFESQLDEEMRFHLEMKARAGGGTNDAGYAAQRQFGNATLLREESRDMWGWVWLETLVQDVRYGARMLRKNPGFTFVATATLALGIAVNSTIFSIVSGWLLKKPPVADPDRLVVVVSTNAARAIERGRSSEVDFLAWRNENHVFNEMAAADPYHDYSLTGTGEPERLTGMRVTANYFGTLGVPAFLGRTFLASEAQPGRDHVVVLTYSLWQRRFASDANIAGKTIALDGEKYVVIGVMPAWFRQVEFLPRLWTPLLLAAGTDATARDARSLVLFGRLKAGVDLQQARAEMTTLARRAEGNYPASAKGWGANVLTLQEYTIEEDQVRMALVFLMTGVALVLLIACANIANLLLARAGTRQQEIAIRIALGAGRVRVIRQLLVESLLIALIGGAAGLLGAYGGVRILRGELNLNDFLIAAAGDIALDHRVLAFTCLVSIGAALVFGLAPAIRVSGSDPQGTLRQGGRAGDLRRGWGRDVLVGGEIALALVLLIAASLIIKATAEERAGDFGFNPKQVLTANISLTSVRYHEPARRSEFFQSVLEKVRQMPGVEAAGIASSVPFAAERRGFKMRGQTAVRVSGELKARYFAISPGQLRVLSTPLIRGREFSESDNARAPHVAIVNRVFAERFFPGQDPLGHYIQIDHDEPAWSEIVGIVGNIRGSFGPKEDDPQMYEPYLQVPMDPEMWLDVRAAGDPNRLAPMLRKVIWSVDPDQPIAGIRTIARIIDENEGGDYVADTLFGIFGIMALVLSAIGIYGVISYAVAQRTHEIGIRMAFGAHRGDVLRSVIGKGMLLALGSTFAGLAVAALLPKLFAATLQGFRVHSLPIFVCVPLILLLVVLAAIYIPARRAARVDPMVALRYE